MEEREGQTGPGVRGVVDSCSDFYSRSQQEGQKVCYITWKTWKLKGQFSLLYRASILTMRQSMFTFILKLR